MLPPSPSRCGRRATPRIAAFGSRWRGRSSRSSARWRRRPRRALLPTFPGELLKAVLARGEAALARTPELLDVLREAGVVDAGGAGLVEIVRGVVGSGHRRGAVRRPLPPRSWGCDAIHRELSEFRYCTAFLVEGDGLDGAALEHQLEALGDSLLVVGDESALKVARAHRRPGGGAEPRHCARERSPGVEIADMHVQTAAARGAADGHGGRRRRARGSRTSSPSWRARATAVCTRAWGRPTSSRAASR